MSKFVILHNFVSKLKSNSYICLHRMNKGHLDLCKLKNLLIYSMIDDSHCVRQYKKLAEGFYQSIHLPIVCCDFFRNRHELAIFNRVYLIA